MPHVELEDQAPANTRPNALSDSVVIDMPDEDESTAPQEAEASSASRSWRDSIRYFFSDVLNPREYVSPASGKRLLTWLLFTLSLTAIVALFLKFDGANVLQGYLSEEILLLSIVVYAMEPLKRFLSGTISRFPKFEEKPLRAVESHDDQPQEVELTQNERIELLRLQRLSHLTGESIATLKLRYEKNKKLMVMIPCYKTMEKVGKARITEVIKSALKQVPPENIYIVDNGPWEQEPDETRQVINEIHPAIDYQYFPYPGKTTALMKATVDVLAHRPELEYVLTFDNDVTVPDNYQFRHEFFSQDKRVKAIVYPIHASSPNGEERNLLTRWQDIDYVFAGANKSYLGHFGSIRKPHGAVSCWELKTLYKLLQRHNGQFRGEDWQLGDLLRTQYSTEGVLKFAFDAACFFDTDVPQSYFAPDGRWPQQVRSWMVVPYLWPWKYVLKPLLSQWRTNTFGELLTMKFEQLYEGWSLFSSVLRYPLMALQATDPKFWIAFGSITVADLVLVLITNYALLPKYLRNDLKAILTYPLHKQVDSLMQVFAFLRTILIEFPKDYMHPSIQKLIDDGILPSFNTDDDSLALERAEANIRQAPGVHSETAVTLLPRVTSADPHNSLASHGNTTLNEDFARLLQKLDEQAASDDDIRDEIRQIHAALRELRQAPPQPIAQRRTRRVLPQSHARIEHPIQAHGEDETVYDTLYDWSSTDSRASSVPHQPEHRRYRQLANRRAALPRRDNVVGPYFHSPQPQRMPAHASVVHQERLAERRDHQVIEQPQSDSSMTHYYPQAVRPSPLGRSSTSSSHDSPRYHARPHHDGFFQTPHAPQRRDDRQDPLTRPATRDALHRGSRPHDTAARNI